jgi:hypothetical protein
MAHRDSSDQSVDAWLATTRRRVLASGATGAGGATAGCVSQDSVEESTASPLEQTNQPNEGGRRDGVVRYSPNARGPYPDLEAAVEDVPKGGLLLLGRGRYDVASEGRIVRRDKQIFVRGTGYFRGSGAEYGGTVLDNTGDPIDEPVIELARSDGWRQHSSIGHLGILHEGNAPGIRIANFIRSHVHDCGVECRGEAPFGVKYEGSAFFARMYRTQVSNATDISVHVASSGYATEFYSNHISTSIEDARAAFQTETDRTVLVGGECATSTESETPAIRYYGTEGPPTQGGFVVKPGVESSGGIEIDGEDEGFGFNKVHLYSIGITPNAENFRYGVRFGRTRGSMLIDPEPYGFSWENAREELQRGRGDLVKWSPQAQDCGVVADASALTVPEAADGGTKRGPLTGESYTDEGAQNPHVMVRGAVEPKQLSHFPTGVPTYVPYSTDTGAPLVHDGDGWFSLAAARSPYTPPE